MVLRLKNEEGLPRDARQALFVLALADQLAPLIQLTLLPLCSTTK
jgi:hypothetical protein